MADGTTKRTGAQLVKELPEGAEIVAMTVHKDRVVVATSNAVFAQNDEGVFVPVEFAWPDECDCYPATGGLPRGHRLHLPDCPLFQK